MSRWHDNTRLQLARVACGIPGGRATSDEDEYDDEDEDADDDEGDDEGDDEDDDEDEEGACDGDETGWEIIPRLMRDGGPASSTKFIT